MTETWGNVEGAGHMGLYIYDRKSRNVRVGESDAQSATLVGYHFEIALIPLG